jgi:hypothetical protein
MGRTSLSAFQERLSSLGAADGLKILPVDHAACVAYRMAILGVGEPIGSVSPPDSMALETARGQTNISSKNARIAAHERAAAFAS